MRLIIGLCKYCRINKDECEHQLTLRAHTQKIPVSGTLVHHCPEYYKTIPKGARVKIELKEIKVKRDWEYLEPDYGEWGSAGFIEGTATGRGMGGFIEVQLATPVKLMMPDGGNWAAPVEKKFTHKWKRANEIKVLDDREIVW